MQATVAVSEEQYADLPNGMRICYQTFGERDAEPMLLVMGLGGPMTWWDPALCSKLAERGFLVIRFDNRDTGRSGRARGRVTRRMLVGAFFGRTGRRRPPYLLDDLAGDAFGLLDQLGIRAAHLVGVSMGGMVVQTMAVSHPERVRSLTSIMSTTGKRTVGWQDPRLLPLMIARRAETSDAYVASSQRLWRVIGSPAYPETLAEIVDRARETYQRGVSGPGVVRQMLAILAQPDRSRDLRRLRMPALVIHGLADKMVHVSGGRATARAIPGAELMLVPGMGHDIPTALYDQFADAISRTASRA